MKIMNDRLDRNLRFGLMGSAGRLAARAARMRKEAIYPTGAARPFNFLKRRIARTEGQFKGSKAIRDLIAALHYRYNKDIQLFADVFRNAEKWNRLTLDGILPGSRISSKGILGAD